MKCVMCEKSAETGVLINGLHRCYRVCKECLKKHRNEYVITHSLHQTEWHKSMQIKKYIQEQLDKRLNEYLLGGIEWK